MGTSTEAAHDLYVASYDRLVRVLTLAGGSRSEAEDVVQEAFVRLLGRWPTVSKYEDPEAWVRKVAFRLLSNRARRARNAAAALLRSSHGATVGRSVPSGDGVDIDRALATLSSSQRQVVVLHHLLDMPVHQIATELGLPAGTVKSRLARARAALAPLLTEEINHV
jgi:RNA polymerase sigma-70 factor (ECF subfamily)